MKAQAPFGVLLIKDGGEVGPSTTYEVGSLATITDFYQGSDGLLGVTAIGGQRFRLLSSERQRDGLNVGDVELIETEEPLALPEEYRGLSQMLAHVLDDLGSLYDRDSRAFEDAVWVTYRFLEILPIDLERKQRSLESSDTVARLKLVGRLLDSVRQQPNH